jgi:uncharacterized protein
VSDAIVNFSSAELAELHADSWTAPFWKAAHEHRLVVARCAACGHVRMPPGPYCPQCRAPLLDWAPVSGRGEIYAFTIVRHAVIRAVSEQIPYAVAVVELCDAPGVRLVASLWDVGECKIVIGHQVEVVWDDVSQQITIPRFRPVRGANQ